MISAIMKKNDQFTVADAMKKRQQYNNLKNIHAQNLRISKEDKEHNRKIELERDM